MDIVHHPDYSLGLPAGHYRAAGFLAETFFAGTKLPLEVGLPNNTTNGMNLSLQLILTIQDCAISMLKTSGALR